MKRDAAIDFHRVAEVHLKIHDRLLNWARYVGPNGGGLSALPMFRLYISTEHYESPVGPSIPVDSLDGHEMEKAVAKLPEKHAMAIRWYYVFPGVHPGKVCRGLAVSAAGLQGLVTDGRSMLKNRATEPSRG